MLKWLKTQFKSASAPWCQYHEALFSDEYLSQLADLLLNSPYLSANILNSRFATTRGFSAIFSDSQRGALQAALPQLQPFLEQMIRPEFNLYYLNALVLTETARVERHIDHSIRGYGSDLPWPRQVSVLYVDVPPMRGGELHLLDAKENLWQRIIPRTGLMVCFRGDLKHLITPVETAADGARLSLVCEQYRLSAAELACVPTFTLKSSVGFEAFLGVALTDDS